MKNRRWIMGCAAALVAVGPATGRAGALPAVAYGFDTNAYPTFKAPYIVSASDFRAFDAAVRGATGGVFRADGFREDPLAHAFELDFHLEAASAFRLTGLSFSYAVGADGPSSFDVLYSDDGLNWTSMLAVGPRPLVRDGLLHAVEIALPAPSDGMSATVFLEIYGYGAATETAVWTMDDVRVHGEQDVGSVSTPPALQVALQHRGGAAGRWSIFPGVPVSWDPLNLPGPAWRLRGFGDNRLLLQQGDGGAIGYWDFNENPVRWHPVSGPVPGIVARDISGPFVLLQAGEGGMTGLWELDGAGRVAAWIPVGSPPAGWIARAMHGDRVLLQRGAGGLAGFWHLDAGGRPWRWTMIKDSALPGWVLRDFTRDRILLQQGEGGPAGYWLTDDGLKHLRWEPLSPPLPGWTIGPFQQVP